MKKNLTLSQWLIEKTDGEAYRAGKLSGESSEKSSEKAYVTKHPKVDQQIINQIGSLTKLISQAREMEKDAQLSGFIRFDWRDMGNDIRAIHYSVEIIPLLCDREGIEDPRKRQQRHIKTVGELLQEASQSEADWLKSYYRFLLTRLEQGKLVKEMDDEAWFACLNAIGRLHCPTWKRVFSARVFRDSKRFQTSYEDRVVKVLREYSDMPDKDVMTNEQILKACACSSCVFCRGADAECGKEFYEIVCGGLSGRCDYCAGMYYLFCLCGISSGSGCRCGGSYDGVELYRGTDFQHAGTGRRGKDGRPGCAGNDGIVKGGRNVGSKNQSGDTKLYGIYVFRTVYAAVLFFGVSLWGSSWTLLSASPVSGNGDSKLGMYLGGSALCSVGLFQIPRNDCRTVFMGMV